MVSVGGHLALGLWHQSPSTYICPLAGSQIRMIPITQLLSAALDCYLALSVQEIFIRHTGRSHHSRQNSSSVLGSTFLVCHFHFVRSSTDKTFQAASAFWFLTGVVVFTTKPEYRDWLLPTHLLFEFDRCSTLIGYFVLFLFACTCTFHCVGQNPLVVILLTCQISHLGLLEVAMTLTTICIAMPSISFVWKHRQPYPHLSYIYTLWSFILLLGGYLWFHHTRQVSLTLKPVKASTYFLIFLTFLITLYPALSRPATSYFHPIDLLLYQAKSKHDYFASYPPQSYNIRDADAQYRRRYVMKPPPGFDEWHRYACSRLSVITDQYDQIYQDLMPFWSISPKRIREMTWELTSNPWNGVGGIAIREGKATILANVPGTHRWMLDGVIVMMDKFVRYLPDMDIAFNLNDEARVAVPFDVIQQLRSTAMNVENHPGSYSWSRDRANGWKSVPKDPYSSSVFREMAKKNTFSEFGSVGCESSTTSRRDPELWQAPYLCLSCAAPHSMGQFLSNWSLSADPCHQPDLAHLHGLYSSPAAFKGTNTLVPVFSQSKPHGFNDILYPSAWNYMDKVVYAPTDPKADPSIKGHDPDHPDPLFVDKENTLFWRGATSEGLADGKSAWRGMVRQRLVHLVNNATSSAHDMATILLPTDSEKTNYRYMSIPGAAVKNLGLRTDIAIVDRIARCGGKDCVEQEAEFNPVKPVHFQSHWRYRFLFDLDGAGFSGRFLPFLQSNSVPFKAALFREWYDERITAWHHFVPIDLRLHGMWSTLAYFAGVSGVLPNGQKVEMKAHIGAGERIAQQGKWWASQVLRKEDMEVYFFRVLLEWGRLTDDNRENMGFIPKQDP